MIKFAAFIPARAGSKSIPWKNIKPFCGQPLIYWVLNAAQDCPAVDAVYLFTDSPLIEEVACRFGLPKLKVVRRSPETATDSASTESALLEFADQHLFENVVLLQATSPLVRVADLNSAIARFLETNADSLVSGVWQKRFIWQMDGDTVRPLNYDPQKRPRRQEWDGFFVENGAMYITSRERLLESRCRISGKIVGFAMPPGTYFELDEEEDWIIAEGLKKASRRQEQWEQIDFSRLNLLICDVDGVLTDAGLYYVAGQEARRFNVRDGKGIELIREAGIKVMFLTSEDNPDIQRRAEKLKIDFLCMGIKDKYKFLETFFGEHPEFNFDKTAYIGDDVNDLNALQAACFSAAPQDGNPQVKSAAHYICQQVGGRGCVREVCNLIVAKYRHAN